MIVKLGNSPFVDHSPANLTFQVAVKTGDLSLLGKSILRIKCQLKALGLCCIYLVVAVVRPGKLMYCRINSEALRGRP